MHTTTHRESAHHRRRDTVTQHDSAVELSELEHALGETPATGSADRAVLVVGSHTQHRNAIVRAIHVGGDISGDVYSAASWDQARNVVRYWPVDCIVFDTTLDDEDVVSLIGRLHNVQPSLACVIVVDSDQRSIGELAIERGAQDFIVRTEESLELLGRHVRSACVRAQREAALTDANRDLDAFAAVAAHDLKLPLGVVMGYAELLQDNSPEDAMAKQWTDTIMRSVQRANEMIDGMLEFSRKTIVNTSREWVDLAEVVEWACESLGDRVVTLGARITCDELPAVWTNRAAVRQLVLSIVDNALKYRSTKPPRIRISAVVREQSVELQIADNGRGIPEDLRSEVFQLGVRAAPDMAPGSGIGLASCASIVRKLGGTIFAAGNYDGGTTIVVTVPNMHIAGVEAPTVAAKATKPVYASRVER